MTPFLELSEEYIVVRSSRTSSKCPVSFIMISLTKLVKVKLNSVEVLYQDRIYTAIVSNVSISAFFYKLPGHPHHPDLLYVI